MDKFAIARALREIAGLLGLKEENPYKVRAYEKAARALEEQSDDVSVLVREDRLTVIQGIGEATAARIRELHETGRSPMLDDLRGQFPPGVADLAAIREVGPKKALALAKALGVSSVAELRAACESGRLRGLKGFGEKTEKRILEGLARHEERGGRILLVDALALAEPLLAHLRSSPAVVRAEPAGPLRRWQEIVTDIDLAVATDDEIAAQRALATYAPVEQEESSEPGRCVVRLARGPRVVMRTSPPARFGTTLLRATGSLAHLEGLRAVAHRRHLELGANAVILADGAEVPCAEEAAVHTRLGLPYIPPELREGAGEIEAALAGDTFDDLLRIEDIRGMVHAHTTWSDGRASIEEMARAAEELGLEYLTITDHSPTASYAGGVALDRLEAQRDEIAAVQERVRVRLLRGTESDILLDGALDYPDRVLESFDVVIASIHQRHKLDADGMTRRLVRAMQLPVFKIWGHALGRLLLQRDPVDCDVERVLDAVASSRAAVEVNGDPYRLDLEPRWLREARRRGIRFVVSTDAHSVSDLRNLRFGVHTARRGWVRRHEVLNTLPVEEFRRAVKP